ncbi:MAG: zinc-ribbon domain-containing protein [Candidatus Thorarchaeota archaeon]
MRFSDITINTSTQIIQAPSFCPYCGAQVTASGMKYCASCGKELPIT